MKVPSARGLGKRVLPYLTRKPANKMPLLSELRNNSHVLVGRRTYGDPRIWRWVDRDGQWLGGRIEIGSFCSIADDVSIFTGGEHNSDWVTTYPVRIKYGLAGRDRDGHPKTRGDVRIGNDVWLGAECVIMSGVTIGDGAVVAARAVVTKDVRPYAIVAGVPAAEIKRRFDDATVEFVHSLRWWEWPDAKIVAEVNNLCGPAETYRRDGPEGINSRSSAS
jgi:acetyltransferase-like isoleucine patch superfamily enzyme